MNAELPVTHTDVRARQRAILGGNVLAWTLIAGLLGASVLLVAPRLELSTADLAARLGVAGRLSSLSAIMLLAGIGVVGSTRFRGEAWNPLAEKEDERTRIHVRYVQNTLEQLVLHVVAVFALAADGHALALRFLPGLTACFVVGRALFWAGYLKDPVKRGPGFAMTFQPTAAALVFVAGHTLARLVSGG